MSKARAAQRDQNHSMQRVIRLSCAAGMIAAMLIGCTPRQQVNDSAVAKQKDVLAGIDLYTEGAQAYRRGDTTRALRALEEAVHLNPNLRMAQAMLADVYRNKGDYGNAAEHYQRAAELDPYQIANHYNLGVMLQYLRRFQDAAAAYLRALDLDPRDLKSNMNLGTVYLALGKMDESINFLERATMLDPNSAEAWSNLGVAYDSYGKVQLAEKAYRRALELNGTPTTMQNLGANLVTQGRAAEAIELLKQVTIRSNTAIAHKRYADALSLGRQYDEALKEYDTSLQIDRNFYPAMNEKGFVLLKQYHAGLELDEEKLKQAVALWNVSIRLNPRQTRIQQALKESQKPGLFGG